MNNFWRSPITWISATILSILCYAGAFYYFPKTFPIINLSITMDREQALEKAALLAQNHHLGPEEHHDAALFSTDHFTKTFIELEAGGTDAFVAMMKKQLYMPYTWNVRHFKENEKNEVTFKFTPDGTPYGFIESIAEETPGAQLNEQSARNIAQADATNTWDINFDTFTPIEYSQKQQLNGRIDHTFVYQHAQEIIGEGFYRLKIQVTGDKVTELTHFVKVPETFIRRYNELRSANNTIAWAASLIMFIFYIIGGCGILLYWISRKRAEKWATAAKWGTILAGCLILTSLNNLPSLWMHYHTALSLYAFLIQLLFSFSISFFIQAFFLSMVIMAAENLTRQAFGHHPQLWTVWSLRNASSYAVLGRTVGAYLLVGLNIAYVIGFYLFTTRVLNWWTPSELLFDPNILATYVPWFAPLAQSLNAGFIEECLFRAIPLAGAALLGNRFGKRNIWIAVALVVQALVFGAAHANYPTQPAYARLIELIFPSLIWGGIYLKFGLLSVIIMHTVYDVVWFSIPIFVSTAPQAILYKAIIVTACLVPLIIVLYARIKNGRWTAFNHDDLNAQWQPTVHAKKEESLFVDETIHTISPTTQKVTLCFGIIALALWLISTPFSHDGGYIRLTRYQALQHAQITLDHNRNNVALESSYRALPFISNPLTCASHIEHTFIWKEGKKELYHQLLNTYLQPAHWSVRYAQFEGDIIERAEEHMVKLHQTERYTHQLPESSPAPSLTKEEARTLSHTSLQEMFYLRPDQVNEVSAQEIQRPNRKDWLFTFSHAEHYPLSIGQARINIAIAGNEVTDTKRFIHVPEEWQRNELNNQQKSNLAERFGGLLTILFLIALLFIAYNQSTSSTTHFSLNLFIRLWIFFLIICIAHQINTWLLIISQCNTSQPLTNQLFTQISSMFVMMLIKATSSAALITYIMGYKNKYQLPKRPTTVLTGLSIGIIFAALTSLAGMIIFKAAPLWADYTVMNSYVPLLLSLTLCISTYVSMTIGCSLICMIINRATHYWRKNKAITTLFLIMLGLSMIDLPSLSALPLWIAIGIILGTIFAALYHFVLRYDIALIPLATGSSLILSTIQQGLFNAYPVAPIVAAINVVMIAVMSACWFEHMNTK